MEENREETLQESEPGQEEQILKPDTQEEEASLASEEDSVPVQSAFAGAEVYEEAPDWDTLLGKDLTEFSQQKSWRKFIQKCIVGVLAAVVVLLAALLMIRSGTAKKAAFLDQHIALITPGSAYYHTYDCEEFDHSSFVAYNIKTAEKKGYTPCPKCHE